MTTLSVVMINLSTCNQIRIHSYFHDPHTFYRMYSIDHFILCHDSNSTIHSMKYCTCVQNTFPGYNINFYQRIVKDHELFFERVNAEN